jgi:hypothetical protein
MWKSTSRLVLSVRGQGRPENRLAGCACAACYRIAAAGRIGGVDDAVNRDAASNGPARPLVLG